MVNTANYSDTTSNLLLYYSASSMSSSIKRRPRRANVLILTSIKLDSVKSKLATDPTVDPRTGEISLPPHDGTPDDRETACPKASHRSCGTETGAPFYANALLNKAVYAARHGYGFALLASDDFKATIGKRTGEFAKPHMLKYALTNPKLCGPDGARCDWVVWLDADSWIHPTLMDLPLDTWLHDVPSDRHLVLGNRVALNTGVLFLRGGASTAASLQLLEDWMGVSHLIQCHAFDQAALQLLLLQSLWKRTDPSKRSGDLDTPFGFTCVQPRCSQNLTKNAFWSCNPLFDHTLQKTGWGKLLQGFQNYPRLDIGLWVANEGPDRPRLHVVEKTVPIYTEGIGGLPTYYGGWDYGGNFDYNWTNAPHSPTWFVSHHKQTRGLFFAGHQTRRACGPDLRNCTACVLPKVEPLRV